MTVDPVEDSPPLPPIYVDQDDFSHFWKALLSSVIMYKWTRLLYEDFVERLPK